MGSMIPELLRLEGRLDGHDLIQRVPEVRALALRAGMPKPQTFKSPIGGRARPVRTMDLNALTDHHVRFETSDGITLTISAHPDASGTLVQATYLLGGDETKCRQALRVLTSLLEELFMTGQLEEGHVERVGADLEAVPLTPVSQGFVALVTTDASVDAAYNQAAAFWDAWDQHKQAGGRHLLARGVKAATSGEWFRAIFEKEWAMARAARPGQTRFGIRRAPPGCEGLLMAGQSCLREIGTRGDHVELAGFVPEGAHVPPWEILSWNEILFRGCRDDGSPVSILRVVFRNERMALAEATPLLDIGAQVVFLGHDGQYHAVI